MSQHAILDSGTSLTYIPTPEYYQVIPLVKQGKYCYTDQGFDYCKCAGTSDSSFPTITLYFMGANGPIAYEMTSDLYLGSTSSASYCFLQLVEEKTSNINFWLLGDNFLRGYY